MTARACRHINAALTACFRFVGTLIRLHDRIEVSLFHDAGLPSASRPRAFCKSAE